MENGNSSHRSYFPEGMRQSMCKTNIDGAHKLLLVSSLSANVSNMPKMLSYQSH